MQEDIDIIKRIFPNFFKTYNIPPNGAKEEAIKVYRACKTGICDKASFTPTFEEQGYKYREGDDPFDPSLYSLSVYENPKHVKRFAIMNSDHHPPFSIAVGLTEPRYGLVQRTRERKGSRAKSHIAWWLYVDATPCEVFELIPDFKIFLEEYNDERKEKTI